MTTKTDNYSWDVEDSEYVYLGDGESVTLRMKDEGAATTDKYNNSCVDFDTENVQYNDAHVFWRVTSVRVKRMLKALRPLTGKVLEVTRIGESYETRYNIVEVTNIDQFTNGDS